MVKKINKENNKTEEVLEVLVTPKEPSEMSTSIVRLECTTCHTNVVTENSFIKFKCPGCGEVEIIRCERCRKSSNIYKCPKCGFEGP